MAIHLPEEVRTRAEELSHEFGTPVDPSFEVFVVKARQQGIPDEREWTYIGKDGSTFPVLLSVTALHNPDGSVRHIRARALITRDEAGHAVRMIGTNWDITPEMAIKAELATTVAELHKANILQ